MADARIYYIDAKVHEKVAEPYIYFVNKCYFNVNIC